MVSDGRVPAPGRTDRLLAGAPSVPFSKEVFPLGRILPTDHNRTV